MGERIAADDVDRARRAEIGMQFPHEIDGLGIDADDFVAAPVAHQIVDLLEGGGNVAAIHLVGDGQAFLGVDVIERKGAGFAAGRERLVRIQTTHCRQGGGKNCRQREFR